MGTRVDFYSDREWLGSLAFDGYRIHEMKEQHTSRSEDSRLCWLIKTAMSDAAYRQAVAGLLKINDDGTVPSDGWPWPWDDSCTTDRAVVFTDGTVKHYAWGKEIVEGDDDAEGPEMSGGWPNMSTVKNAVIGTKRDGVIVVSAKQ
jgi:hypothetical protein